MSVNQENVRERVYKIIAEHTGKNVSEIKDEQIFIDDLGLDSLDLVELVMAFEEEFEQEIPDEAAEKLNTVGATIKYIESNSAE